MISNQDGLGWLDYPWERFLSVQNRILDLLKNEGISFSDVLIDRHYKSEKAPTRKPGTGLLTAYMNADYDVLSNSYVIGDRDSDIRLAKNLCAKSIFIGKDHPDADFSSMSWKEISAYLIRPKREISVQRKTTETDIDIRVDLDGSWEADISTGIGFFDHMLELFAKHAGINRRIRVKGDLQVDTHHSIEDTALVLGETIKKALGNKRGIERYGFLLPMDESLAQVALDISGRPDLQWNVTLNGQMIGEFPSGMLKHFFRSLCDSLGCSLNIKRKVIMITI
ncbi:MAG: HAD hydrolase-like protein [Candidatus Marinimicrobia bacterium]|nr:HAD hydrolase-like protein [Candidatus Neomarinimicrobiota bacterium]